MSTPELRAQIIEAHQSRYATKSFDPRKKLPWKIGKRLLNRHAYRRVPSGMNLGNSCW
jgi:hypothetical protein